MRKRLKRTVVTVAIPAVGLATLASASPLRPPRATVTPSLVSAHAVTPLVPQKDVDRYVVASLLHKAQTIKTVPINHPLTSKGRIAKNVRNSRISAAGGSGGEIWDQVAQCESHGHWNYGAPGAYSDGDGFEGGLNFASGTWVDYKPKSYPIHAYDATRNQQIYVGELVLEDQGWAAWPACSKKLGLR